MDAINAPSSFSHIPTEVIHDIIDQLPTNDSDYNPAWSDLALVSRCCRHRVNFYRFSKLEIRIHATPISRLEALAWLLGSNVWQLQEGISQHIKTVSLVLGQQISGEPPFLPSRDTAISKILMNLFEGGGNTSPYHDPHSSLTIGTDNSYWHYANNGPYDTSGLSFDTLGSETIAALHVLLRRRLTTLRLERMWNIPSSLLSSSTILNLYINHAHFTTSDALEYNSPLPSLMYLEIKEAPSFVTACYRQQNKHTGTISKIKYWLREEEEYPGLSIIGNYATILEIVLHKSKILRYQLISTILNTDI